MAAHVPNLFPDPGLLAAYEMRSGSRFGFQYAVKGGVAPSAMDVLADEGDIQTDDSEMSIYYPFASGQSRDRVGDYLDVSGIETANHERNPLAFLDHGKNFKYPLGLDQDRQKRYTVTINPERGLAFAKTFITPICPEHEQIFLFYKKGILRAGSIGYRTIEEDVIGPDREQGLPKGKHLRRTELLETSAVFLPCSQDAVLRMYDEPWAGKSLAASFRKILEPQRPRKKPWVDGGADFDPQGNRVLLTVEVREKSHQAGVKAKGAKLAPSPSPAMSTTDATGGGALVPPPKIRKKDAFPKLDGPEGDPTTPTNYEDDVADQQYDTTDAEQETGAPVSHNVQRVKDVHYMLEAVKELHDAIGGKIDEDPHLVDHPDIKALLNDHVKPEVGKLSGKVGKLQSHIASKFAKSHPDESLPDYGGSKDADMDEDDIDGDAGDTDEEKNREDDELEEGEVGSKDEETHDDSDAGDNPKEDKEPKDDDIFDEDEVSGEPEHEDKPEKTGSKKKHINWNAPVFRTGNKGSAPRKVKRLNMSQKSVVEEVADHLKECASHPDTPKMHKAAHMHYHAKLGDLFGDNAASDGDPAMSEDAEMDQKALESVQKYREWRQKKLDLLAQRARSLTGA